MKFYGFDWGTYCVTESGRKWLIQHDSRDDLPDEVQVLPAGGEWLDPKLCFDLDLTGVED